MKPLYTSLMQASRGEVHCYCCSQACESCMLVPVCACCVPFRLAWYADTISGSCHRLFAIQQVQASGYLQMRVRSQMFGSMHSFDLSILPDDR